MFKVAPVEVYQDRSDKKLNQIGQGGGGVNTKYSADI